MLIQNRSLKVGDVASLKLITGDEVIGRVVEQGPSAITLAKPIHLMMQMVQTAPGMPPQAALQFAPFMVGAPEDGNFTFEQTKLLVHPVPAREDVAKNYTAATSSIVPATAMPGAAGLIK